MELQQRQEGKTQKMDLSMEKKKKKNALRSKDKAFNLFIVNVFVLLSEKKKTCDPQCSSVKFLNINKQPT